VPAHSWSRPSRPTSRTLSLSHRLACSQPLAPLAPSPPCPSPASRGSAAPPLTPGPSCAPDPWPADAPLTGIFAVARRFFLLFQMHANYACAPAASRTLGHVSAPSELQACGRRGPARAPRPAAPAGRGLL
jgi:hypothetical protein